MKCSSVRVVKEISAGKIDMDFKVGEFANLLVVIFALSPCGACAIPIVTVTAEPTNAKTSRMMRVSLVFIEFINILSQLQMCYYHCCCVGHTSSLYQVSVRLLQDHRSVVPTSSQTQIT
jgi:hypothetical protein